MTAQQWLTVVSCAGLLGLAAVSAVRAQKTPLGAPLAGLCLVLFGWNFATLAHEVSGLSEWRYIDTAISPFTAPATLHFVLVFVGERNRYRKVLLVAYAALALLSLASAGALFVPALRSFAGSEAWALAHIALMLPVVAFVLALLLRHRHRSTDPAEQMRTRLVLAAFAVGAVFASTELWGDLGVPMPRMGALGTFGAGALLAAAAFRMQLLGRDMSRAAIGVAIAIGAAAVFLYLIVFHSLASSEAMLVIGTITITFGLVVALLPVAIAVAQHRGRRDRMALLGRMSDQMAHDLKNPLAAVKGAVQFLKEERDAGRPLEDHAGFLDLIESEADRIARLIDRYRRLGRMELSPSPVVVNQLVERIAGTGRAAAPATVSVRTELDAHGARCVLDADLLVAALDNLVVNAIEAMPDGGALTLGTTLDEGYARISVADEGTGMDARTRDNAFDEFFTTKASGSGLGLPFVRRVAEAHGGRVDVQSAVGKGTTVSVWLPIS